MTKARMTTLLLGVAVLAGLSYYRLRSDAPPLPPRRSGHERASAEAHLVTFGGETMGTTYTVKYLPPHPGVVGMAEAVTEGALTAVVASMSTYEPESEISKFNALPRQKPFPISPQFAEVLQVAQDVHDRTSGAFDVTVWPLVSAYGFGAAPGQATPSDETLAALKERVGMDRLLFDEEARTIAKKVDGVALDFGGIAKGYGVDRAAEALEKLGILHYMVEVGGEIRVRGSKNGGPWKLALEEPSPEERRLHGRLSMPSSGAALATSGDYRNFREVAGERVSHTFDPRTLTPTPRRTASLSVVRPTATEADALATALSVLTPEEALAIAERDQIPIYMLLHEQEATSERPHFVAKMSAAWKKLQFKRLDR